MSVVCAWKASFSLSPSLKVSSREIGQMALHRAEPALLRDDDGDRLLLDHRVLDVGDVDAPAHRRSWCGACRARCPGRTSSHLARLPSAIVFHCLASEASSASICFFSAVSPSNSLRISNLLELAQGAQPHVEDRLGLDVGQREARHHHLLRLVLLADDADHLVEVEIGDQVAAEDFQPLLDLGRAGCFERRTSTSLRWSSHSCSTSFSDSTFGTLPARQHVHVEREAGLELGQLEQRFHQQRRDRRCGSSASRTTRTSSALSSRTSSSSGSLRAISSSAIFSISRAFCT